MSHDDIIEKVKAPIAGDSPVGEDPKYEAAYEGIREEVAKTSGIGHGACDWQKVFEDSLTLISETAKEKCPPNTKLDYVGEIEVPGKRDTVIVYSLPQSAER